MDDRFSDADLMRKNDELLKRRADARDEAMNLHGQTFHAIKTRLMKGEYAIARNLGKELSETILYGEIVDLFKSIPEVFACARCGDNVQGVFFREDSLTWIRPELCDNCDEVEKKKSIEQEGKAYKNYVRANINKILNAIEVEELLHNAALEGFPQNIVQACRRSVIGKHGLYINGDVGVGKSWLSVALVKEVIFNEDVASENMRRIMNNVRWFRERFRFVYVPWFLMELRSTYDRRNNLTEQEIIDEYSRIPLVVFDDIGSERPTEWVREKLNTIIYYRNLRKLKTIYTSNYAPDKLQERLDERITSRILQQCEVITLTGPDRRRQ